METFFSETLTPKEASKILRVTENTLSVWRCTKRYSLPYLKIGSKVLYRAEDINSFLKSRIMQEKNDER